MVTIPPRLTTQSSLKVKSAVKSCDFSHGHFVKQLESTAHTQDPSFKISNYSNFNINTYSNLSSSKLQRAGDDHDSSCWHLIEQLFESTTT